jgi:flagellar biosynthesis/type III secretory pathway protein FliH
MMDPKKLEDIIKSIPLRNSPVRKETEVRVTREQLEQQAKEEAEQEAKQEAQKVYDETYADAYEEAYQRILDDLVGEHGFLD